jgi:hypothetical protein
MAEEGNNIVDESQVSLLSGRRLHAAHLKILILRVRGADVSIKPGASAPGSLGNAIKAREAGGSRIISTNVRRYGYHPLRGFTRHFGP